MPEPYQYDPTWLKTNPIAHRGLHDDAHPEDSLAAFRAAVAKGYPIELDVHITADRDLVVFHDRTTLRLTGQDLKIATSTYPQLRELRLEGTAEYPPRFSEVLELVAGQVPLLPVEIKHSGAPNLVADKVATALRGYRGQVAVESFDPRILWWFRRHASAVPRLQAASSLPDEPYPAMLKRLLMLMPLNWLTKPNFIVLNIRDYPYRPADFWVRRLKAPLLLWPVSDDTQIGIAAKAGANIIFDHIRP